MNQMCIVEHLDLIQELLIANSKILLALKLLRNRVDLIETILGQSRRLNSG
jgi:hypothetical protein